MMKRIMAAFLLLVMVLASTTPGMAQGGPGPLRLPVTEDTFFQLKIPTLDVDVPVFEAWMSRRTWEFRVLTEEAGHLQYTAYPGMRSNVVIGGHYELADFEPGPFYTLDEIEVGDAIDVVYMGETFHYEVISTELVRPQDVRVIYPTPVEVLTLLTCYDYSPQADTYTRRFVVRAVRVPAAG